MKRILAFAAALVLSLTASRAEDSGFIRVDEDATAARLQTAVTRYEKDGATVDLIGAVHIGDRAYYQALNKRFEGYEVLLFEMIGGENINGNPDPEGAKQPNPLRIVYDKAAKMLKLTGQIDHIDYSAKNFLHADLTVAEFTQKQADRGESLFAFMLNAQETATQPNPFRVVLAAIAGRADLLKLALIHTLGDAEDQITSLAGESVIISDRNVRCLEVLDREMAAGRKKIGIFYGAAHFPDMEKRLLNRGFVRSHHEWLTAWNVMKPIKKVAKP